MAKMRSGHLVIGVAIVVSGCALMVIALARQAERNMGGGPVPACIPASTEANAPMIPSSSTAGRPTMPASAASVAPSASVASSAAPSASSDPPADPQENRLFKFSPGGATMSQDEVIKLLALGKAIARHPTAKVSVEGFGDLAGTDPLMMGIAKHRAKVAQKLLSKVGVAEDRVTLTFSDMGTDTSLVRSIRVTTTPPISEVEKP